MEASRQGRGAAGEFIPLLERNGFITNLDLYVWDMVCARLHDWIAAGHKPVPIAVNVSRIDIYSMNVTNTFVELTGRYGIAPALLAIEITEAPMRKIIISSARW